MIFSSSSARACEALELAEPGRELAQLLCATAPWLFSTSSSDCNASPPGAVQGALVLRESGASARTSGANATSVSSTSARRRPSAPKQRQMTLAALAQLARRTHVVDAHEHLAALDDCALAHQDLGDDAALQVLHHLDLARGDHLAVAPGDLLELGPPRPGEEHDEEGSDREQEEVGEAAARVCRSAPARPSTNSASARPGRRVGRRAAGPAAGVAALGISGLRPDPAGGERLEHVVPRPVRDHPSAVQHDQPLDQRQERGAVGDQEQGLAGQDLLRRCLSRPSAPLSMALLGSSSNSIGGSRSSARATATA